MYIPPFFLYSNFYFEKGTFIVLTFFIIVARAHRNALSWFEFKSQIFKCVIKETVMMIKEISMWCMFTVRSTSRHVTRCLKYQTGWDELQHAHFQNKTHFGSGVLIQFYSKPRNIQKMIEMTVLTTLEFNLHQYTVVDVI